MAHITPVDKKTQKAQKITTDHLVYCQTFQICVNGSFLNKCQTILEVLFSLNINVDLERVLQLRTV